MGLYGGGSSPKPKDYTKQNNALISSAQTGNNRAAADYNQRVSAFNNALLGGGGGATGGSSRPPTFTIEEKSGVNRNQVGSDYVQRGQGGEGWEFKPRYEETPWTKYLVGDQEFGTRDDAQAWVNAQQSAWQPPTSGGGGTGLYGQYQDWAKGFGDLDIADFWDDPTTAANENRYDSLYQQGTSLRNQLSRLNPDFGDAGLTTLVQGPEGGLTIGDLPNLLDPRDDIYNQMMGGFDTNFGQLDSLLQQRRAEEQRINQYQNDLTRQLGGYQTTLGQLGIEDEMQINNLERELGMLQTDMGTFSSPILEQLGGWNPNLSTSLNALTAGLGDIQNQRQSELDRISTYEQDLLGKADNWWSQLDDLGIADADQIDALDRELDLALRGANRFSSDLNFDLSQEAGELMQLDSRLGGLQQERQNELNRIKQAQQGFSGQAADLQRLLGNASATQGGALDTYAQRLAELQSGMSGFESELDADFSGVDTGSIEAQLADLQGQHNAALDPFQQQISQATGALGGLELWDTEGRKAQLDALNALQGEMNPYTGTRANELREQLQGAFGTIDEQNTALNTRRGELTTQAEELLEQITGGQYYDQDQVGASRAQADELAALVEQFGANSANDEMAGITDFLQGQTNRLEQDEQNLAARSNRSGSLAGQMLGLSGIDQMRAQNYLGDDQIAALVAMIQRQQQQDPTAYPGSGGVFSASLGV